MTETHQNQSKNEGEGSREADRQYREGASEHAQSRRAREAAEEAREAIEGDQAGELERAEERAKSGPRTP